MIRKITLKNFQIHRKLVLDFDEKLNIIQGANDSGKSSIIRALFWTFYNSPSGDWMRRIDKNGKMRTCIVKIVFSDGIVIKRIKGEKINRYSVNDQNFDNFGYDVPDEVKKAIGILPFKTLKEEFNPHVSMQDERGFLIHESSPTKASVLDTLTGVSALRKGIKSFNSEQQELKRKLSFLDQEKIGLEEGLSKLISIESISIEVEYLKQKDKNILGLRTKKDELIKIRNRIQNARESLKGKEKVHELEKSVKECVVLFSDVKEKNNRIVRLNNIALSLKRNRKKIVNIPTIKQSELLMSSIKDLNNLIATLQGFKDSIRQKKEKIKENVTELEKTRERLDSLKKEIGICPLCEGVGKWTQ